MVLSFRNLVFNGRGFKNTIGFWVMWGLEVPIPCVTENLCVTSDPPKLNY